MSLEIREVRTSKEMNTFVKFPLSLYKNHPYYVPALIFDDLATFNPKKNPAYDFCESICFLAYRNNKIVGRIAGLINKNANEGWKVKNVRFGWFDAIDDLEVTKALMDAVAAWGTQKGMTQLTGPLGFTDMDPEGMLIEGYDLIGTLATIYNYPYYPVHLEKLGFEKEVDWKEFRINIPDSIPDRYQRMATIVSEKFGLRAIKEKSLKKLVKNYGEKLFQLINETYCVLYGFSTLTERQMKYYIKMYLSFARTDLISIVVDKDDKVVGMGITMPSLSKALQKSKGSLFPFGFIHLLKALKKNNVVDFYLMAVHPDYQNKGVSALIFADLYPNFIKNGLKMAETNPELETNTKIQVLWSDFNPEPVRRRRVFKKELI
ncbi:MAG TPA: N-acetyltransferase [Bacteroidales bacterium]|nr:N-acetyltransferase [Bacteroidales bacterium]